MFETLTLPSFKYRLKSADNKILIFDLLRKKFISLTKEEWVRQHLISYLINYKSFPPGLCSVETRVVVNKNNLRYDVLVYDRAGEALVLIECKAPEIKLTQAVFDQAMVYNSVIKAKYILISNGIQHFIYRCGNKDTAGLLSEIPDYDKL